MPPTLNDDWIRAHGMTVRRDREGKHVEVNTDPYLAFGEEVYERVTKHDAEMAAVAEKYKADAIERAIERQTEVICLERERGDGWYAAECWEEKQKGHRVFHVVQLNLQTGQPLQHANGSWCECTGAHKVIRGVHPYCHHWGAAFLTWQAGRP